MEASEFREFPPKGKSEKIQLLFVVWDEEWDLLRQLYIGMISKVIKDSYINQ